MYLQLDGIRNTVAEMALVDVNVVKIVVSPYRICPLGAHIDHQVAKWFYLPLFSCFLNVVSIGDKYDPFYILNAHYLF